MDLCLDAARKLHCYSERLIKNANAEPSTKDGIETLRLCASLLRSPLSIDTVSPLTVRNRASPMGVCVRADFILSSTFFPIR
jgi:hypothetical protein